MQLNAVELNEAEQSWIKSIQAESFESELRNLEDSRLPSTQLVKQLGLFLDEHSIVRCEGRICNSSLPEASKRPVLLLSRHHFTQPVIQEGHKAVHHNGVRDTLNCIRERFWILRVRESMKRVIKQCVICKKLEGKPFRTPKTPHLPAARVGDAPPFAHTGIDFAGLLCTASNSDKKTESSKVYVCLYTCASSRAVHLELVPGLSVPTFLQSFRRFVARRGLTVKLISDNAKTFKSSAGEVAKIARSSEVQTQLANKGVSWDFIVERPPWHGGFWERMVRCVKRCLKKSIGRTSLTFEELRTILVEVEATLNNRPLTYTYDDEEGVSCPLTPADLIYGSRISSTVNDKHFEIVSTNRSLTKRAKYHQQLLHQFTRQWRNEYLTSLRERNADMRGAEQVPISVGDIVILKNESSPRLFWKVARVEELLPGRDNVIRSARICVLSESNKKTMLLRRPVQHLIPLEVPVTN